MRRIRQVLLVAGVSACAPFSRAPTVAPADVLRAVVQDRAAEFLPGTTVCLTFVGIKPPRLDDSWVGAGHRVVGAEQCPRTYASMIRVVDSTGRPVDERPAGYIDPFWVRLWAPRRGFANETIVRVELGQGTWGRRYLCEVLPGSPQLRVQCGQVDSWIS